MTKKKQEMESAQLPEEVKPPITVGSNTVAVIPVAAVELPNSGKDDNTDWNTLIDKKEGVVITKDGNEFVLLKELLRLARLKGIRSMHSYVVQAPSVVNGNIACATSTVEFKDGTSFDGSADASEENTDKLFSIYLTALAESRAIARALRFGLGITMCSFEEVSTKAPKDVVMSNPEGKLSAAQKQCIEELLKRKKFEVEKVLSLGSRKVNGLDELNNKEARDLITALNDGTIEKAFKGK